MVRRRNPTGVVRAVILAVVFVEVFMTLIVDRAMALQ
jgi:hypothetical protein